MAAYHDEVEIEDFEYDARDDVFVYPCPCGDRFKVGRAELEAGQEAATCPSCSLMVKVVYDQATLTVVLDRLMDQKTRLVDVSKVAKMTSWFYRVLFLKFVLYAKWVFSQVRVKFNLTWCEINEKWYFRYTTPILIKTLFPIDLDLKITNSKGNLVGRHS